MCLGDGAGGFSSCTDVSTEANRTWDVALAPLGSACVLFGDCDEDGDVDDEDIKLVAGRWRCRLGEGCYDARYDPDGDDDIDIMDIMQVAAHWGEVCSP